MPDAHERTTELLPWFVNGSLDEAESALVEQHVRDCLPCRNALKEQQRLAMLVRDRPLVDVSPDRGFDRLMQRLDGERIGSRRRPIRTAGPAAGLTAKLAIAASLVVAAMLGAGLWMIEREQPAPAGEFSTLTDDGTASGPRIDIVFADGLTEAETRALLRELDASVVAGPTQLGRYTVRVPPGDDVDEIVRHLLADPRVRFAGRSFEAEPGQ